MANGCEWLVGKGDGNPVWSMAGFEHAEVENSFLAVDVRPMWYTSVHYIDKLDGRTIIPMRQTQHSALMQVSSVLLHAGLVTFHFEIIL